MTPNKRSASKGEDGRSRPSPFGRPKYIAVEGPIGVGKTTLVKRLAHQLSARYLKYLFIIIMFYMGLKLIGTFEWLGWPI